jgi:hypothetical protein
MGEEELLQRVEALRSQGRSPKQIARALGVRPARVAPLVRAIAREQTVRAPEPAVTCWVSPGWSAGLAVPPDRDWPDRKRRGADETGLVCVLVARDRHRHRSTASVSGFLVDTYCLGVKDAFGPHTMGQGELRGFRHDFFRAFAGAPVEAPAELARHVVWGAVEYARGLGFRPHPDFRAAARHLGPLDGPSAIGFGRYGRPYYMQGPYDDTDEILQTLEEHVGEDFHFTVALDPDALARSSA